MALSCIHTAVPGGEEGRSLYTTLEAHLLNHPYKLSSPLHPPVLKNALGRSSEGPPPRGDTHLGWEGDDPHPYRIAAVAWTTCVRAPNEATSAIATFPFYSPHFRPV